jgi:hypothetical protein
MIDDPADNKSVATLHTAELEIKWEHFGNFVKYGEHKLEIKVENKVCDVNKPGIYKLISQDESALYVGQGQSVLKRLSDYKNARYELLKLREGTNRRIQGWMLRLIEDEKGPIEIFVCTLAYIRCGDEMKELDLHKEYNRLLIENLEISNRHNQ